MPNKPKPKLGTYEPIGPVGHDCVISTTIQYNTTIILIIKTIDTVFKRLEL